MLRLSKYGLRSGSDFDKYTAVVMAESASMEAHRTSDPKASFLEAACQTLRAHLATPTDKFQAYYLALFSDKDYTKVLESISKVDKVFKQSAESSATASGTAPARQTNRPSRVVCYNCGMPGHVVSSCFRRRQPGPQRGWGNARFSPYSRPAGSGFGQRPSQGRGQNY